jgi:hypothetical protein
MLFGVVLPSPFDHLLWVTPARTGWLAGGAVLGWPLVMWPQQLAVGGSSRTWISVAPFCAAPFRQERRHAAVIDGTVVATG